MQKDILPRSFKLLFKATLLYNTDVFLDMEIHEIDEVKEQLMTMRIFLAEGIQLIEKGNDIELDLFVQKLEIIESYLEELSGFVPEIIDSDDAEPYGEYHIHN